MILSEEQLANIAKKLNIIPDISQKKVNLDALISKIDLPNVGQSRAEIQSNIEKLKTLSENLDTSSDNFEKLSQEYKNSIDFLSKKLDNREVVKDVAVNAIVSGLDIENSIKTIANKDTLLGAVFKFAKNGIQNRQVTEKSGPKKEPEVISKMQLDLLKDIKNNTSRKEARLQADLINSEENNSSTIVNNATSELINSNESSDINIIGSGFSKVSNLLKVVPPLAAAAAAFQVFDVDKRELTRSVKSITNGNFSSAIESFQNAFSFSEGAKSGGQESSKGDILSGGLSTIKTLTGGLSGILGIDSLIESNNSRKKSTVLEELSERIATIQSKSENTNVSKSELKSLKLEQSLLEELIFKIKQDDGELANDIFLIGAKNISSNELKTISDSGKVTNTNTEIQTQKGRALALSENFKETNSKEVFDKLVKTQETIKILEGSDETKKSELRATLSPKTETGSNSDFISKNETGKTGIESFATISSGKGDSGGESFGRFQFASNRGTIQKFIKESKFKESFGGLKPKDEEFKTIFRDLARTSEEFRNEQVEFAEREYFGPTRKLVNESGIDFDNLSTELKEVLKGTTVQFGQGNKKRSNGLKRKLDQVKELSGVDDLSTLSEKEIITFLSDAKIENVNRDFKSSSSNVQNSVKTRFQREEQVVLSAIEAKSINNVQPKPPKLTTAIESLNDVENNTTSTSKENVITPQTQAQVETSAEPRQSSNIKITNDDTTISRLSQRSIFNQVL